MPTAIDEQPLTSRPDYRPAVARGFRGFVQGKTRVVIAWVAAIALGLTAREMPTWPGIALCFFGATIRFWASGYLRKDTRPAVGGPYAWVRNPLYLGTYLMALGTALAAQSYGLLGALTVVFAVLYHFIILDEETKLHQIFGAPYAAYCAAVPRFFPKPWPASREKLEAVNPEPSHARYDWALSRRNKAYEAYLSWAGLIGFVALMSWVWGSV